MFPTSAALIPVFKRFFEMKLDGVDQLAIRSLNHHLISAEIRSCEQSETSRNRIELQTVILPYSQDAALFCIVLPHLRLRVVNFGKNRILRLDDANQAILILNHPVVAALTLFLTIESYYPRAETQADHLMAATDTEHWNGRHSDKLGEAGKDLWIIVIKITQRAAKDDGIGMKIFGNLRQCRNMSDTCFRLFHQTLDVAGYVLQGHLSDLTLALEIHRDFFSPLSPRDFRDVTFVAQKIIDDQDANRADALRDRFIATKRLLVEREGKRLRRFGLRVVQGCVEVHLVELKNAVAEMLRVQKTDNRNAAFLSGFFCVFL